MKFPISEHFKRTVEFMEDNYGIVDCIYVQCMEEFSHVTLGKTTKQHETRIIRAFLFDWGKMQRWLGANGLEEVGRKIKERAFIQKVQPLRKKSLRLTDLEKLKRSIIDIFDDLAGASFKTEKGRVKKLNPTTASKILHLCCPDLFMMWDADIRYEYGKGSGQDYYEFLSDMKKFWKALEKTMEQLQRRYGKRATRIMDEFNWHESHKNQ